MTRPTYCFSENFGKSQSINVVFRQFPTTSIRNESMKLFKNKQFTVFQAFTMRINDMKIVTFLNFCCVKTTSLLEQLCAIISQVC